MASTMVSAGARAAGRDAALRCASRDASRARPAQDEAAEPSGAAENAAVAFVLEITSTTRCPEAYMVRFRPRWPPMYNLPPAYFRAKASLAYKSLTKERRDRGLTYARTAPYDELSDERKHALRTRFLVGRVQHNGASFRVRTKAAAAAMRHFQRQAALLAATLMREDGEACRPPSPCFSDASEISLGGYDGSDMYRKYWEGTSTAKK
jgi:hypothetical protein